MNAGKTETGAAGCEGGGKEENLEALEGGLAAGRLVLHHGADGAPDHARGRTEVEGATAGVGVLFLLEDRHEQQLVADEAATHTPSEKEPPSRQFACCNPLVRHHAERLERRAPRTGWSLVSQFLPLPSPVPAGDVDLLAADKHNALTSHELLSDDGAEATKEVPAAVDHHGVLEHASRPVRHTHTRTITIGTRTAPAASHHSPLHALGFGSRRRSSRRRRMPNQLALMSFISTTLPLGCRPPRPRSAQATHAYVSAFSFMSSGGG